MPYQPQEPLITFRTVSEDLENEESERLEQAKKKLSFGVKFLDKALGGILPNDLILLGSKTGTGKTELATSIAAHNAALGKRVHFFALEAEDKEIARRIKYRHLAMRHYEHRPLNWHIRGRKLNYMDWYEGKFRHELHELETQVSRDLAESYKTFYVTYRRGDFALEQLKTGILSIKAKTDLIIVDHIHYIDIADENENRGLTEIIKAARDLSIISGKPMIIIAHLRKGDRRLRGLVPDLEDFHGTSNLSKVVTKAILMGPCPEKPVMPYQFMTYMQAGKNRRDGSRTRYAALCTFDSTKNSYLDQFALGSLVKDGTQFEPLKPSEYPYWTEDA